MYSPTSAACHEVPQAVMMTRRALRSRPEHVLESAQLDVPFLHQQPAPHGVADRLGLLVDLLQHEVVVAAALDLGELQRDLLDVFLTVDVLDGHRPHAVAP